MSASASPDVGRLVDVPERLVAFDTQNPPGHEARAAAMLAGALSDIGFEAELREVADGRANVVARLDNGVGPCLAFNSHIDTVPTGAGWSSDPFRLIERDDRLCGRGACDAKGSISAMVEAGRLLLDRRRDWRGTLLLAFVADEEIDGAGAKALVKQPPSINWVVVGEPTSNAVCAAHKGCVRPLLWVKGRAAHSGLPELGALDRLFVGDLPHQIEGEVADHGHVFGPMTGAQA